MSGAKEPDYFSPDVVGTRRGERKYRHPQDESRYLKLFEDAANERRVGESSTTYLMSRLAPQLVTDFAPDVRVVAIVRNPVDLVYSLYHERLDNGVESQSFAAALALDAARNEGQGPPPHGYGAAYLDNARQGEQLQRWMRTLGPHRVLALVFDDFARNTPAQYQRVLRFLEVDEAFSPKTFAIYNASHRRRGAIALLMRNRLARAVSHTILAAVPSPTARARIGRRIRQSRVVSAPRIRPPLAPQIRRYLEEQLGPDVEQLGQIVERDLTSEWFGSSAGRPDTIAGVSDARP
jgi:hypothetical protein